MSHPVKVEAISFQELIDNTEFPLGLDNYQRPYVWTKDKIQQLLEDLIDFKEKQSGKTNYYMGVLLLHKSTEKEHLFVIDGQQRLTSLSVLYHALTQSLPPNIKFKYRSPLSVKNIQHAQDFFDNADLMKLSENLFDQLSFTVVTVDNEDLAFTFFDTQNNRGVPLEATDLLKAFHLRAINSKNKEKDESLQKLCARRWEELQQHGEREQQKDTDFAPELFHYYLWRARNWTGQKVIVRETHEDVLETFQARSVSTTGVDQLPLYSNENNCRAKTLTLQENDQFRLQMESMDLTSHAANLPFSLRQPIHQGIGFFLYAEKYAALIKCILHKKEPNNELTAFQAFYRKVVEPLSYYLRELYLLAIVMYVDKFAYKQLLEFALWLDHSIGAIRLDKYYIFKQAPLIYLKDNHQQNLLDVITGAYRPDEIIHLLKMDESAHAIYRKNATAEIENGKGVRGNYLKQVLEYYGETQKNIQQRDLWINEPFIKGKVNAN